MCVVMLMLKVTWIGVYALITNVNIENDGNRDVPNTAKVSASCSYFKN